MKIIMLQDELFGYLQHVVRAYAANGIEPEEGLGLFHLSQALKGAQTVEDNQVAKVKTGDLGGVPVAAVAIEQQHRESSEEAAKVIEAL